MCKVDRQSQHQQVDERTEHSRDVMSGNQNHLKSDIAPTEEVVVLHALFNDAVTTPTPWYSNETAATAWKTALRSRNNNWMQLCRNYGDPSTHRKELDVTRYRTHQPARQANS